MRRLVKEVLGSGQGVPLRCDHVDSTIDHVLMRVVVVVSYGTLVGHGFRNGMVHVTINHGLTV